MPAEQGRSMHGLHELCPLSFPTLCLKTKSDGDKIQPRRPVDRAPHGHRVDWGLLRNTYQTLRQVCLGEN